MLDEHRAICEGGEEQGNGTLGVIARVNLAICTAGYVITVDNPLIRIHSRLALLLQY